MRLLPGQRVGLRPYCLVGAASAGRWLSFSAFRRALCPGLFVVLAAVGGQGVAYAQPTVGYQKPVQGLTHNLNRMLLAQGPRPAPTRPPAVPPAVPPDSLRPYALPTVAVAARPPADFEAGARFTLLDSLALRRRGVGASLGDVLSAATPLAVKHYGPGQLASVGIRGTSARHVAVQWNGFTINFPTLGEADFALFPAAALTSATVQYGPAGAAVGTGAVGGVVTLNTAPTAGNRTAQGHLNLETGSFGQRAVSAEGVVVRSGLRLRTSALVQQADNDFTYSVRTFRGVQTVRQANAGFRQWSLTQDAVARVGRYGEVAGALWLTQVRRQLGPPIGTPNTHAREFDASHRLVLGYTYRGGASETRVQVAAFDDVLNYAADGLGTSDSRTRTTQAHLTHTHELGRGWTTRFGAEGQQFRAQVQGYGSRPVTEQRAAAWALVRWQAPGEWLTVSGNVRQAALPGQRAPLTPTLSLETRLTPRPTPARPATLRLKANVARSYRAPTLNERYWRPGGNPALRAENGWNYEVGLVSTTPHFTAEATAYELTVNDWVQWLPTAATGVWAPRNLRRVRSRGVEATLQGHWQPGACASALRLSYALTHTTKRAGYPEDPDPAYLQLPYVPRHSAALTSTHTWRAWQFDGTLNLLGQRFTNTSGTEALPAVALLGAGLRYALPWDNPHWQCSAALRATNLANTTWQGVANYPQPGRAATLTLSMGAR